MECMKCGREIEEGNVFCESCLANMGQYPVKSDIVVQLPYRRVEDSAKKPAPRRHVPTEQERLRRLTLSNQVLRVLLVLAMLMLCFASFNSYTLMEKLEKYEGIGKNYSTVDTTGGAGTGVRTRTIGP